MRISLFFADNVQNLPIIVFISYAVFFRSGLT